MTFDQKHIKFLCARPFNRRNDLKYKKWGAIIKIYACFVFIQCINKSFYSLPPVRTKKTGTRVCINDPKDIIFNLKILIHLLNCRSEYVKLNRFRNVSIYCCWYKKRERRRRNTMRRMWAKPMQIWSEKTCSQERDRERERQNRLNFGRYLLFWCRTERIFTCEAIRIYILYGDDASDEDPKRKQIKHTAETWSIDRHRIFVA